jgi:hypothetical protein
MINKSRWLTGTLALLTVMALTGCNISINPVSTGALRTERIDVPRPADMSQGYELELNPGAASITVDARGENLVNGSVEYNVDDWKPIVSNSNGRTVIGQKEFAGIPPLNSRNDWAISLGRGVPLSLTVNAGAIHGSWELGGLSLRALEWKQGAADTIVRFSEPNPAQIDEFNFNVGASTLSLLELGNLNAAKGRINIGAGTLLLQLDGALTRDLEITLEGGAAAVTIDPGNNPVQVIKEQSFTMVTSGDWTQYQDTYSSPQWDSATGHKVTIRAQLGAASLNLVDGR